jgi:transcriptional regulator of NAD metabolism
MAATPRDKILARRRRLEAKQNKIKAFQEKIRQEEKRLATMIQDQEELKHKIIGRIMAKRMADDRELKAWFGQEIERQLTNREERNLFDLN